jgi:hypothetical protein
VAVDDQLAAVLALDLENAVVQAPVDIDVRARQRRIQRPMVASVRSGKAR